MVVVACSPNAEGPAQSTATPVACRDAKTGDPCDGSERSCVDPCRRASTRYTECHAGHWVVGTVRCDPPPRPIEAGVVDPAPYVGADTVGQPCIDDTQCDPLEHGSARCSIYAFTIGPLNPTGVCIDQECDPARTDCDHGRGVCNAGLCLPKCTFGRAGESPSGCIGKNACVAFGGASIPADGGDLLLGYCLGGCATDGDCASVKALCQRENGRCVSSLAPFTKNLGDSCTSADDGKACACRWNRTTKVGFCTQFCRIGDACASGWVCDAALPEGTATAQPTGLAGTCAKTCATDGECAALNARCVGGAGLATKVCRVEDPSP